MKKITLLLGVFLLFSAPAFAKKDAAWVVKKAKVENDPFEQATVYTFPTLNYRQMGGEVKQFTGVGIMKSPYFNYFVKAKAKADKPTEYVIEVKNPRINLAGNKSFANYKKAVDNRGKELAFTPGEQFEPKSGDITRSTPEESFSITLDEEYVKSHKDTGIVIKVYGESESPIFHISPWYIDGMLQAVNQK